MVLIVFGLLAVLSIGFASVCYVVIDNPELIAPPPPVRTANSPPEYVIGDLGGMPVKIDHRIVQYIEYEGDPRPGEKRKGPRPQRTYASRLESFLFYVRYPDMGSLTDANLRADYARYYPLMAPVEYGLRHKNPWITGAIQSGSNYPGHGLLDRWYQATLANPETQIVGNQLVRVKSDIRGLELYVDLGTDSNTGEPWRYSSLKSGDTYVHRDATGKVSTFVQCKYRSGTRRYAFCKQYWGMESFGLNIQVSADYAPSLLPQWQDIQIKVSQFVLSFKVSQ